MRNDDVPPGLEHLLDLLGIMLPNFGEDSGGNVVQLNNYRPFGWQGVDINRQVQVDANGNLQLPSPYVLDGSVLYVDPRGPKREPYRLAPDEVSFGFP
jgi:hypothetical protein